MAQIWRGGTGRQVSVARLLTAVEVVSIDDSLGRLAGTLLGRSGTSDAVDACVVALCHDGDIVLTSDAQDLLALAISADTHIELVAI